MTPVATQPVVKAADYDAYWLWAGVGTRAYLKDAKTIYLLQGEIGTSPFGVLRIKAQGGSRPFPHNQALWLVYRVRSLDWTPEILAEITRKYADWHEQPGGVVGIQIDFDAQTRHLDRYVDFLHRLRLSLPPGCALGITGLMDWAAHADPKDLNALSGTVDEIIFQTYRGRETVRDIDDYLMRMRRLRIPFRLGLAEGASWSPAENFARNPYFRGYVIFLRNSH